MGMRGAICDSRVIRSALSLCEVATFSLGVVTPYEDARGAKTRGRSTSPNLNGQTVRSDDGGASTGGESSGAIDRGGHVSTASLKIEVSHVRHVLAVESTQNLHGKPSPSRTRVSLDASNVGADRHPDSRTSALSRLHRNEIRHHDLRG